MKRYEFTEKIKKFVDAPYALDDKNKGWDCLNLLDDFYRSVGIQFPEEFRGINKNNYAEAWNSGRATKIFKEFLLSLGSSINPDYARPGDLFIFDGATGATFSALYHGKGNVLIIFSDVGKALVMPLKTLKRLVKLVDVRRL